MRQTVKVEISTQDRRCIQDISMKCSGEVLFKTQKQDDLLTLVKVEISNQDSLFKTLHSRQFTKCSAYMFCSRRRNKTICSHSSRNLDSRQSIQDAAFKTFHWDNTRLKFCSRRRNKTTCSSRNLDLRQSIQDAAFKTFHKILSWSSVQDAETRRYLLTLVKVEISTQESLFKTLHSRRFTEKILG